MSRPMDTPKPNYGAVEAFARGLMTALLQGVPVASSEPPSRSEVRAKRKPRRHREPARPRQLRLDEMPSPVPELDRSMPAPPYTQAEYENMERALRGEAATGYYAPHEGGGAGDGVS